VRTCGSAAVRRTRLTTFFLTCILRPGVRSGSHFFRQAWQILKSADERLGPTRGLTGKPSACSVRKRHHAAEVFQGERVVEYVAGVDSHKGTHTVVILDAVGVQQASLQISADAEGYAKAITAARTLGQVTWGIEGSGSYGRAFARVLVEQNFTVYEVPGVVTKRHRRHGTRHGKSDAIDACAVAEAVLRERARLPRVVIDETQETVRLLYDRRNRLLRDRTTAINRVRALAMRLGIEAMPADLSSKRSLKTAHELVTARRGSSLLLDEIADEMTELLDDIERLVDRVRQLERKLRPFVERLAPGVLRLPGASTIVAAGIFGHAGALTNYRSASAFAMRAGVAPVLVASGKSVAVRVNHTGDRQLNRCLHVIALTQVRLAGHPGQVYYERKRREGKTHRAAIRALKRQLATVVYYRLREESALGELPRATAAA